MYVGHLSFSFNHIPTFFSVCGFFSSRHFTEKNHRSHFTIFTGSIIIVLSCCTSFTSICLYIFSVFLSQSKAKITAPPIYIQCTHCWPHSYEYMPVMHSIHGAHLFDLYYFLHVFFRWLKSKRLFQRNESGSKIWHVHHSVIISYRTRWSEEDWFIQQQESTKLSLHLSSRHITSTVQPKRRACVEMNGDVTQYQNKVWYSRKCI